MNLFEKIITWYFSKSSLPYWCIFLIDCLIVFLSAFFVYWTVHRGLNTLMNSYAIAKVMLVYLAVSIVSFRIFHTYSGIVRYSSFVDLARVASSRRFVQLIRKSSKHLPAVRLIMIFLMVLKL